MKIENDQSPYANMDKLSLIKCLDMIGVRNQISYLNSSRWNDIIQLLCQLSVWKRKMRK